MVFVGSIQIIDGIINRANERELRGQYDALVSRLDQDARRAAAMSAVVAAMPSVQEAFARGDRPALLSLFGPGFAFLKSQYGVDQLQFHLPPATSFARIHQPAKFGDDLSGFRKTVVIANREQKAVVGLENGVAGLGIRGVVPMAFAGKHIGTVEFGLTFGQPFFDQFKRERAVDVVLHLERDGAFKAANGTLNGKSFFGADDYRRASDGAFLLRQQSHDAKPVAVLLGPVRDFSGRRSAPSKSRWTTANTWRRSNRLI